MAKKKEPTLDDNLLSIGDVVDDTKPKKEKKVKTKSKTEIKDDLADIIKNDINKTFKDEGFTVAYFLDGTDDTPADVVGWVSTGNDVLDMMISNRRGGGLPVGRLIEYNGLEGTGKTLFCASSLAETQKIGGLPVFIDSESSISPDFMRALGIQFEGDNKLVYIQLDTVEDAFATVDNIIRTVRENAEVDKIVTIVLDSLAGLSTKVEMEDDFDQAGYATQKAIIISKAMRKLTNMIAREKILFIFTNQLRTKMNVQFGDPWTTSGGKAPAYHSSVRIRLKNTGYIKDGNKKVVGINVEAKIIKNRMGPPMKVCKFDVYFDSGIDNIGCIRDYLKEHKVLNGTKAKFTYTDKETGEKIEFSNAEFVSMMALPEFKEKMMKELERLIIDEYKPRDLTSNDELTLSDEEDEE